MVKKQELIDWIMKQPKSKSVDMLQTNGRKLGKNTCGCVMVQYAREVLELDNRLISCGMKSFGGGATLDCNIVKIVPISLWEEATTFGEIQEILLLGNVKGDL